MAELDLDILNDKYKTDSAEFVALAEEEYRQKVADIADLVLKNKNLRIILLAGPSGSGKTTTANLIKDAIIAGGESSTVLSLDDFYKDSDSPDYPKTEAGVLDYECPEALRLNEIGDTLRRIAEGKAFNIPKYDFKVGGRVKISRHEPMPEGCVIIEGLHALNPKIFESVPAERCLKIFVSLSTNINKNGGRILSGRKQRFVRRLVRDSIYRGADAVRTLKMWRGVLFAEDLYLYPFKKEADISFDTFHHFEPLVMKPFVESLISEELGQRDEYAGEVLRAIKQFLPMPLELVPEDSLIREFIPGGIYEGLY